MTVTEDLIKDFLIAALLKKNSRSRRSKVAWVMYALSALLMVTGILFFIRALEFYIQRIYPPDQAGFYMTAILFAAAAIIITVALFTRPRLTVVRQTPASELICCIRQLVEEMADELAVPVKESPKTAVLAAVLAGFWVASQRLAR